MIPRKFHVPGFVLLAAALSAALLPNLVRASAEQPRMGAAHFTIRAPLPVSHSELMAGVNRPAASPRASSSNDSGHLRDHLVTDPAALRFSWPTSLSAQLDAQVVSQGSGQVVGDLGAIDQYSDQAPWVRFHDVPYAQSSPRGVFEQNALYSLAAVISGNETNPYYFHVGWLASVYDTPARALARVADARSHFQNTYGLAMTDCSANNDGSCEITSFEGGGDVGAPGDFYIYAIFAIDNVTGELVFYASDSDIAADGGDELFGDAAIAISNAAIDQVVAADSSGGNTPPPPDATATPTQHVNIPPPPQNTPTNTPVPTNTPTPTNTPVPQPSVKLTGIGIATEGKDKKLHTATALKSAQTGYFLAQFQVTNEGVNTPSAQITYSYKGKTIATDHMRQVPASLAASERAAFRPEQAAQTLTYYDVFGLKKVKKAVKLQARVDVSVGSAHDSSTVSFSVKTNCKTKNGKKTCK